MDSPVKREKFIVYLMIASFIIMLLVQFFLLTNAYRGKEKEFNDKLFLVVRVYEDNLSHDTASFNRHQTDSSILFLAHRLKTGLDSVFTQNDIPAEFVYATGKYKTGIRRIGPDSSLLWSSNPVYNEGLKNTKLRIPNLGSSDGYTYYLKVFLPSKPVYLVKSLLPLIIILVITLVMLLFCFIALASTIKKQNRLAVIRNDFINNMTHELKTPLFTISIASKMLAEQAVIQENNKYISYVESIQQETGRLTKLIDIVLQTAAIDKKQLQLTKTIIDVHAVIRASVQSFELITTTQNAMLRLSLDAQEHTMYGDETHITGILYSLIDNALKYSVAPADITISTMNSGSNIAISVADKGIGLDADAKKLVFERFFRAHTGDLHEVKGYGIGLSYVKSMTEEHDGTIHVESKPGKGSAFVVTFPTSKYGN
jgi:two-component system phosphate regulon sensor histidine kinase PhoR